MNRKKLFRSILSLLLALGMLCADAAPFLPDVPSASAVTQDQIDKLKKDQKSIQSQKADLQAELKSIQSDKSNALAKKTNLDKQIALIRTEIANTEELIGYYEEQIEQTTQEIAVTEQREAEQYDLFCRRVRAMEERGTISYWSVLFHSANFADLLSAVDFISEIMKSDQRVIDQLRETRETLAAQRADLEGTLAEQQAEKDRLAARNQELNAQLAAAQETINSLAADEAEYKRLLAEKEAEEAAQRKEIDRLSRELAAQQAAQNKAPKTYAGGYIWPCSSHYVTSPVGARYTGIAGASTNHAGIDIGRVGYTTPVVAAKAGTVIISGYNKYRGNYVVVSHGSGNTTTYQHLSKRSVSVGSYVKQGQQVGITGSTGVSRGAHLHFEIMENGVIVNPLKYLTDYTRGW